MMKAYLTLLITVLGIYLVSAQTGKIFWFVAPDATSGHNQQPIYLNLSAYNDSAYIVVSQPANVGFLPISLGIPANGSSRIDLTTWITDIETTTTDVVLDNGDPTLLQASDFIAVPGTGGQWVCSRKYYSNFDFQIGQNYRVQNVARNFHLGIINGGSTTGCLYGYFTDFSVVDTGLIYRL